MKNNFEQNKSVKTNTTYVFVDASNVWSVVKSSKRFIEYKNLKIILKKRFNSEK